MKTYSVHTSSLGDVINPSSATGFRVDELNRIVQLRVESGYAMLHVNNRVISVQSIIDMIEAQSGCVCPHGDLNEPAHNHDTHCIGRKQAQDGGGAELRHMVAKLAAHVRPTCGELWAEAERLLNNTAAVAPVGVEGLRDMANGWLAEAAQAEAEKSFATADARTNLAHQLLDALAQQPAAVDEALTPTGTLCSVCRAPQHNTPSGVSCPSGHGGVAALACVEANTEKLRVEVEKWEVPCREWMDKTEWVQQTAKVGELGMHRADVLRQRIEQAEARVEALHRENERLAEACQWVLDNPGAHRNGINAVLKAAKTHCYQCGIPADWLAPDSRCVDCTRLTREEIE